jgi:two-component system cell cycle sensor histidine kinase/response regulator CckA
MYSKPTAFVSRTILIVDDESSIRLLVEAVLSNEGYTTLCAQDGLEALELSRKHHGPIDLLVSDIMMPRMDGTALGECLTRERPGTAILFMSGYCDVSKLPSKTRLLEKPFTMEALLCRIQELLPRSA